MFNLRYHKIGLCMKKYLYTFLLLLFVPGFMTAQNINGRVTSMFYSFQKYDSPGSSAKYLRNYDMLSLNVNKNNYSFRTQFNYETDFFVPQTYDARVRFYNLYFEGRNLFNIATVKLGRQPIMNSIAGGVFDGATVKVNYKDYQFTGYYGANVPAYQKLELVKDWSNNDIYGAKVTTSKLQNFFFGLSYFHKNYKPSDYSALRLDSLLNPYVAVIKRDASKFDFASAEASYDNEKGLSIDTRYNFDLNFVKTSLFELNGRYNALPKLGLLFYYNYREPLLKYNTILSVFDSQNSQEFEVGADYKITSLFTVLAKVGDVIYKDKSSQRISVGCNSTYGSIFYRKNLGYAGELDAVSLSTGYTFLEGLVTPTVGLSYTHYKLTPEDKTQNLAAVLANVNVRPWRMLSFDVQGQFMNNPLYKHDLRLMFKINYWFNTNLNAI